MADVGLTGIRNEGGVDYQLIRFAAQEPNSSSEIPGELFTPPLPRDSSVKGRDSRYLVSNKYASKRPYEGQN